MNILEIVSAVFAALAACGSLAAVVLLLRKTDNGTKSEIARLSEKTDAVQKNTADEFARNRMELANSLDALGKKLDAMTKANYEHQISLSETVTKSLNDIRDRMAEQSEKQTKRIESAIGKMQESNEKKLDEMRRTVDEKLENTLNQRIGESFGQVNERLEMVHKSLGEIQGLSANMTDIKKIFSNVKTRGVWGEVQLAQILEEILTPDQYAANVSTGVKSEEKVEFAVCLPGRDETKGTVYLPIDSKFPAEDYGRLITAAENGDALSAAECRKGLERTLKNEAKMIRDKYINPPKTLDYAIMFLPTEGLYSEALRLPSFMEYAAEQRVMVTGPTNLAALLNSLKMGFRTLAIEEKSGEIRKLLAMVKTDMARFAASLEKAQKKIAEADKTIGEANHRTELITRRLKNVETGGEENSPADDEIQKNHQ